MEGCAVLREKGHMTEFTAKFRELSVKCDILSRNELLELKSILWALVNVIP
jgi:hypothetical protein